jgi:quinol monooxygenase YgiN
VFALVVRFEVKPESLEEFDTLVAETLRGIRRDEDGTVLYVTCAVGDSPHSRVFLEIYRDEAAFTQHEANEHTRRFLAERKHLVESFRVEFLRPLDGKLPT